MTIYDYLWENNHDYDYDTYDDVYDACVTVCFDPSEPVKDEYDKFCTELLKKVNVIQETDEDTLICDWSKLITLNTKIFEEWARQRWSYSYEDDYDEFIYQWISEFNLLLAGYGTESIYADLSKLIEELKVD